MMSLLMQKIYFNCSIKHFRLTEKGAFEVSEESIMTKMTKKIINPRLFSSLLVSNDEINEEICKILSDEGFVTFKKTVLKFN